MTSLSESASSSSASKREKLRQASRRRATRSSLAGTSQAETPPVRGVPSVRGTAVDVSGESGGGSGVQPKNLEFDDELLDSGGTLVRAMLYPNLGQYCGSVIGQGMFFCLKQQCLNVGHKNHRPEDKIGSPGTIYIVSSGKAPRAFCEPSVDAALLDPDVALILTKKPYPDARLKWALLNELRVDPNALNPTDLENFLSGETVSLRKQMKAMFTPAKAKQEGLDTRSQLAKECDNFAVAVDADIDSSLESPGLMLPSKDTLIGANLDNFVKAFEITHNNIRESAAIGLLIVDEIDNVKKSLGEAILSFDTGTGRDPGIGGDDTGIFTSAWEGIAYINNTVQDLSNEVRFTNRGHTANIKRFDQTLDKLGSEVDDLDSLVSRNIVNKSGEFVSSFTDFINKSVQRVVEEFVEEDEDAGEDFDDHRPRGVSWEGGLGGLGGHGSGNDGHNGGNGGGGPPGGSGFGFDLDVNAEMTKLLKEFEKMKMDMNHLKSVTSTGMLRFPMVELEFESEEQLRSYMHELNATMALPKDVSALFGDLWALMDEAGRGIDGDQRQASDVQIARQRESASKAKFSSTTTLSRAAGFERLLPLLFEAPNTPASPDPIMKPLPGLKKYEDFDCHAGGGQGHKQLIEEEFDRTVNTLSQNITSQLTSLEFYKFLRFAEAFLAMALDQKRTLYDWIRNTYDKEKTASSPQEAWALVAGCIRAIFKEIKDARLIGRAISGLDGVDKEARLIWAMGMGAMKLQEFREVRYHGHSAVQSVYTTYMNRARVPISSFNALEIRVKSMHGEIARLHTEVDKLKQKRSNRTTLAEGTTGSSN